MSYPVFFFCYPGVWCFIMMSSINQYGDLILAGHTGAVAMLAIGTTLVVVTLIAISRQPVSDKKLAFSVSTDVLGEVCFGNHLREHERIIMTFGRQLN